jgi:hypothetical protein
MRRERKQHAVGSAAAGTDRRGVAGRGEIDAEGGERLAQRLELMHHQRDLAFDRQARPLASLGPEARAAKDGL